jgi:hypothetical protein
MKCKLGSLMRNNMKSNRNGAMPTYPLIFNLNKLILRVSITLRPNYPKGNGRRHPPVES